MDQINYSENDGYKVIQMWEYEWEIIKDKLNIFKENTFKTPKY